MARNIAMAGGIEKTGLVWQFRGGKCTSTVIVMVAAEGEGTRRGVALLAPVRSRACNAYRSGGKPRTESFDCTVVSIGQRRRRVPL